MNTRRVTISTNDKITLISNMYTMLSAGIPILETINSLLQDSKGGQKLLLTSLRDDLGQGQHVYYTFGRYPRIFDKVTVNIVKSSEEAGTLNDALKEIKDNTLKDVEFSNKIKSALVYPVFIVFIFLAVLLMILVVVVPKITTVFVRLNVPLPLPTKILMFMSETLLTYTIPVALGAGLLGVAVVYSYRQYKRQFISVLTAMPLISTLAQQIDLTRFTRSLYLLLSAGIPITAALELTQDVVVKGNIRSAIVHTKNTVFAGKKLSEGLRDKKNVIPPIMIKIIEAGERSGSLDKSLLDVSEYLDYQVSNTLKTLTTLMEPVLLVVVGVMVGGMMIAIITPIYGLIGQVGGH